jgi:hypothetical protein
MYGYPYNGCGKAFNGWNCVMATGSSALRGFPASFCLLHLNKKIIGSEK